MVVLALLAHLVSVSVALLQYSLREGDTNIRSVWLCSRSDTIANVAVFLAAFGGFGHRGRMAHSADGQPGAARQPTGAAAGEGGN